MKEPVVFLGKTDLSSAFRVLPLRKDSFCWLIMKAVDPTDGETKFFVEKCLPFGASISCSHYQRFSNALRHIMKIKYCSPGRDLTNYLDDFLFLAFKKLFCDALISQFLELCECLNLPVAVEKTEWSSPLLVFLGILLDGKNLVMSLPIEKQEKALRLLNDIMGRKKATVKQLQVLTGYLNFLTRAIFAGHTFTRRMYAKFSPKVTQGMNDKRNKVQSLKAYHHVKLDVEFKLDCAVWLTFLTHYRELTLCRPMVDLNIFLKSEDMRFTTDASKREDFGIGAVFENHWLFGKWEENFIKMFDPSIEYLELFGIIAAILTWGHLIKNRRIVLYCDNTAVVGMINNMSSSCRNCMHLLRLLVLNNLINNRRVFAKYINTKANYLSDSLSRMQFSRFWRLAPEGMNPQPSKISPLVWPPSKVWQKVLKKAK